MSGLQVRLLLCLALEFQAIAESRVTVVSPVTVVLVSPAGAAIVGFLAGLDILVLAVIAAFLVIQDTPGLVDTAVFLATLDTLEVE
jgi:hypothetical protein